MTYDQLLQQKNSDNFNELVLDFCKKNPANALSDAEWDKIWQYTGAGSDAEKTVQNKRDFLAGTAEADESYTPTEEGTPPAEEETPPAEEETPPAEEETPPAEEETPPAEEETPPAEK